MIFVETKLDGAYLVKLEPFEDERGFFALSWSQKEFAARGLESRVAECNISFNNRKGILRGMHFQVGSFAQAKLVRCTAGAIYDVAVDLRPDSATFKEWVAVELSAENRLMFFISEGMAHGFQTLANNTEVFYQMSEVYAPDHARGVRWNDPAFAIDWPLNEKIMVPRDCEYPDFVQ
jgi:dTDP-4-dehydrorhamnose 3,5-epimerase